MCECAQLFDEANCATKYASTECARALLQQYLVPVPLVVVALATYFCCCHPSDSVLFHIFDLAFLLLLLSLLLRFLWLFSGNFSFGYPQNHELNRARLFCVSARSYIADFPPTASASYAAFHNFQRPLARTRWVRTLAVVKAHSTQTQHPPEQK